MIQFTVEETDQGSRLDKLISLKCDALSRTRAQALIAEGHVSLSGKVKKDASFEPKPGDEVSIVIPEPQPSYLKPADIPISVVYEDDDLMVIDKPAGLTVHPGAGNHQDTLVNALLFHCKGALSGIGGVERPGIVHRLDKDTSGLMVIAKNDKAHQALAAQLADRTLSRIYLALVWGVPSPMAGAIEANIGRHPVDRKRMTVRRTGGKSAMTHYQVKKVLVNGAVSLVECRLETGRTHQIRVHLSHVGHSLLGDPVYGHHERKASRLPEGLMEIVKAFPRQALHAAELSFIHPRDGKALNFYAPVPLDIQNLINTLVEA